MSFVFNTHMVPFSLKSSWLARESKPCERHFNIYKFLRFLSILVIKMLSKTKVKQFRDLVSWLKINWTWNNLSKLKEVQVKFEWNTSEDKTGFHFFELARSVKDSTVQIFFVRHWRASNNERVYGNSRQWSAECGVFYSLPTGLETCSHNSVKDFWLERCLTLKYFNFLL